MKKLVIILFVFCLSLYSAEKWSYTFGDTGYEEAKAVIQTSDSGYVFTGESSGGMLIVKTDSNGELIWEINNPGSWTFGEDLVESEDGYLIIGALRGAPLLPSTSTRILKVDFNGNTIFYDYYPNDDSFWHPSYSVVKTNDNGYALTGNYDNILDSTPGILKLNENCEPQYCLYPPTELFNFQSEGRSILSTSTGSFIVAGFAEEAYPSDSTDVFIYKADSLGNIEWKVSYGDSLLNDRAYTVLSTGDNEYLISGYTESYGAGGKDAWLIKTDSLGNEIWNKTYGGASDDYCYSMDKTLDGNYVLVGSTASFGDGMQDVWLIKVDPDGNELWSKTYGDEPDDVGYSVKSTFDGGYIIAGYTESSGGGGKDAWLIKTDEVGVSSIDPNLSGIIKNYELYQNYPNPFNPSTLINFVLKENSNINLSVFNTKGELVQTLFEGKKEKGNHSINFDASRLNSGVYFYKLSTDETMETRKMLFLR